MTQTRAYVLIMLALVFSIGLIAGSALERAKQIARPSFCLIEQDKTRPVAKQCTIPPKMRLL